MTSALLYYERPLRVISDCGKRARTLTVADLSKPSLESMTLIRLVPDNKIEKLFKLRKETADPREASS
jgi:hypothetical protein